MCGGHGRRVFFSGQVYRYGKRIKDELPPQEYSSEEEEAGFVKVNEAFGFLATLDSVARYVGQDDDIILKTWSVNKFYNKLLYIAWRAHAQKEYSRIMNKKASMPNFEM